MQTFVRSIRNVCWKTFFSFFGALSSIVYPGSGRVLDGEKVHIEIRTIVGTANRIVDVKDRDKVRWAPSRT